MRRKKLRAYRMLIHARWYLRYNDIYSWEAADLILIKGIWPLNKELKILE